MEKVAKNTKVFKIGLKNNALFLFSAMRGDTLGGRTDGIFHNAVVFLSEIQFEKFKKIISQFGYDVEKSLAKISAEKDIDFSCSLVKV